MPRPRRGYTAFAVDQESEEGTRTITLEIDVNPHRFKVLGGARMPNVNVWISNWHATGGETI